MFQVSQDVSGNGGAPGGEVIGVVVGGKKKGRKNSKGGTERKSCITSQDWTVYMNSTGGEEEQ